MPGDPKDYSKNNGLGRRIELNLETAALAETDSAGSEK